MANKAKCKTVRISRDMYELFSSMKKPMSTCVVDAMGAAFARPELLASALRARVLRPATVSQPLNHDIKRVSIYLNDRMEHMLEVLASLAELAEEQVIRLSMEAYAQRLNISN